MPKTDWIGFDPAAPPARRVAFFNAGFLRQKQVRRILSLAGFDLRLFKPTKDDSVAVWGHSPYAKRGEAVSEATGAALLRLEDAFLRSLHPGRSGEPPMGLAVCEKAMHFDASQPSDLEQILSTHPLDDSALLNRARGCIDRLKEADLSKYSAYDTDIDLPAPGYVLVIDQTRGDASVRLGGANANSFKEMLYYAQEDNPGARILIKTHPETQQGFRGGYFDEADCTDLISLWDKPCSPWQLMEGAVAVYVVTSQLGFEAILAGHKPRVFGKPFYAGWGLTDDLLDQPRRKRRLTKAQLFAGAMMLYPIWYDPHHQRLCPLEQVIDTLEAQARAWRQDHRGWNAMGMRLWKRKPLNQFFGRQKPMRFVKTPKADRPTMIWARAAEALQDTTNLTRVEDGFIRSRGLGAQLIPPMSLVLDNLGIYYDPTQESRLERLIAKRQTLRPDQILRAETLQRALIKHQVSKYNLTGDLPPLPDGHRILVPGQVEDDASIRLGTDTVCTNLDLLRATREANPEAVILYKPHPDVEAGLRPGAIAPEEALKYADVIADHSDPMRLLDHVQEVWTMTSLLGFEALLRGVKTTTLGAPFYAGWGLTQDLGHTPSRRTARPRLEGLIHATLIDYPRYLDPITNLPCSAEIALDRLIAGDVIQPPSLRLLAKVQGAFASFAHLWR